MKNLSKYLTGIALVAVFGAYAVYSRMNENTAVASGINASDSETATSGSNSSIPDQNSTPGTYRDGTYTGNVTDAFYGDYQVAAVIKNGKLSDVQFLIYPNDRHESTMINEDAIPLLKSEAIKSQSANVNIISGATQSTEAFNASLATALVKAKS